MRLGESLVLQFYVPAGMEAENVEIFPRYLEQAEPGPAFRPAGGLDWIESLPRESLSLSLSSAGKASITYTPLHPGNYLARWRVGGEVLYRYFSVIEDDWCVLRFSTFISLESEPTLHATGIPLDYRLPSDRFRADDPLFQQFLGYHRGHGEAIIPALPDTPQLTVDQRVECYEAELRRVRQLVPDPDGARSARVEMHHSLDPGYTETFMRLGVNDHCGLNEANARPWLGMPEFPYFASPLDCRKTCQTDSGSVIAHQWDFCGGWHFVGPVSWHFKAAEGNWPSAEKCIRQGVAELANLAVLSGHPAFAVPLYDGITGPGYPNPAFRYSVAEPRAFRGDVDEVLVVARALTAAEISQLMQQGAAACRDASLAWSFDEGEGNNVRDASSQHGDGQFAGAPTWIPGHRDHAVRLQAGDDSVAGTRPVPLCGDFTLALWVRPAAVQPVYANLLSSHNDDAGHRQRGISLEQDGNRTNCFYLIAGDGSQWVGPSATTQLQAGAWQHFAVVRRGGKLIHYRNGEVSAECDIPDKPLAPATDPWRVGDWARGSGTNSAAMQTFIESYQRLVAFEIPKQHHVAFARSIDIADYYRRHFRVTPRTVFVSRTDHVDYDRWWLCNWCNDGILVPRERIPWDTRISSVHRLRDTVHPFKDPLAYEYVLVEDQRRQMRFERESPNPIWWFDYTEQPRGPEGSAIDWVKTPDVDILRSNWTCDGGVWTMRLTMQTRATFPDYAICLWGLPVGFSGDRTRVQTNAQDFILVRNLQDEFHLVLIFDLQPDLELTVSVR